MKDPKYLDYIENVLQNMPSDWLELTTHRLDIYDEGLAKTQFLDQFESLFDKSDSRKSALAALPTAYDYIRLGHPLSSILEWTLAKLNDIKPENVISFQSRTAPVLAVLRKNLFEKKNTLILFSEKLPSFFDAEAIERVYGYKFELKQIGNEEDISKFDGSTIFISKEAEIGKVDIAGNIDFFISLHPQLGSILLVNGEKNKNY